jgi:electron transport complex protein RnfG
MSQVVPTTEPPRIWHMYRAMVGIGLACGLLIVTVFLVTQPIIRHNRAEALQRAIFGVLPDARTSATFRLVADDRFEIMNGDAGDAQLVHAGYDEQQQLVGLAVEAQGMGYQDTIHVLYGYSFHRDAIVGIRVLESRETPGLGDRIETDEEFLANFEQLDVTLSPDQSEILNPIEPVKHGEKKHAWQVDGITGATISSVAIAQILSRSSSFWIPRIRRQLDDFRRAE